MGVGPGSPDQANSMFGPHKVGESKRGAEGLRASSHEPPEGAESESCSLFVQSHAATCFAAQLRTANIA